MSKTNTIPQFRTRGHIKLLLLYASEVQTMRRTFLIFSVTIVELRIASEKNTYIYIYKSKFNVMEEQYRFN